MRKLAILSAVLCFTTLAVATPDIQFSPSGAAGWSYSNATFSFAAQDIDLVLGADTDALAGKFVYLPSMALTDYTSTMPGFAGMGTLAGGGVLEIKDGLGNLLVAGNVMSGNFSALFATALGYSDMAMDVEITQINNTIGSAYLASLAVGNFWDMNLSLQWNKNFDTMITSQGTGSNGMSGSLTVPEPATLVLLGLGGLFFSRKK